ncbi:MAG: redox-active disulfide protein 2 [Bacillota bacterium]|nr:MAG: redox-active disulfide protein 2 [Bacillota bacterium]
MAIRDKGAVKMKNITLLGVEGCPTCARLDQTVQAAIETLDFPVAVEKITEPEKIMEYNAGGLPAVFVNGRRKAVRRVPEVEEFVTWLKEDQA